MINRYTS